MRIALVGKGGAGKTTMSALVTQSLAQDGPVVAIDADINMHMAELLGIEGVDTEKLISEKQPSDEIRTWLRGSNATIATNQHFKKTTPPGAGSRLINMTTDSWFMKRYSVLVAEAIRLVTVGSYSEDGIASSCYHNNLSVLENVLTHTVDGATIVVDMVAGTDAFASTLFAQFDALVFVAEPTRRSVTVYQQYERLARAAGVRDRLYCIGNKIDDEEDSAFLRQQIGDNYTGGVSRLRHVAMADKGREQLDITVLPDDDKQQIKRLTQAVARRVVPMQERLPHMWQLHETYVAQGFVKERFGDLTSQIDTTFHYPVREAQA